MAQGLGDRSRPYRVLLVDDVAELRMLLRAALESSPYLEIQAEAADGLEAVELAARHQPDLVVLDLAMPRQDGLMSLPLILMACPATKVIVLSALEPERFEPLTRELGAVAYIQKGAPPEEIVAAAETALRVRGV